MKRLALVPVALLLGAATRAQDPTEGAAPATADARYRELVAEFDSAYDGWMADYRKARQEGEDAIQAVLAKRPNAPFAAKFLAAAAKEEGDDAVPFLVWVAQNGYGAENAQKQALDLILARHVEHSGLRELAQRLQYASSSIGKEKVRTVLDTLVEKSPHEDVVAAALFSRATMNQRYGKMTPAEIDAACADLGRLASMDVDHRTRDRAKRAIFEYRNLQIGMGAPDIEAEDVDGVPFKLSDYRGKVVVLDFWGDW